MLIVIELITQETFYYKLQRFIAFALDNNCSEDGRSGGSLFYLTNMTRRLGYILIDCGQEMYEPHYKYNNKRMKKKPATEPCSEKLFIYLNNHAVYSNLNNSADILYSFYSWMYKIPILPDEHLSGFQYGGGVYIRVCPRRNNVVLTRLVCIEG